MDTFVTKQINNKLTIIYKNIDDFLNQECFFKCSGMFCLGFCLFYFVKINAWKFPTIQQP